jgi:hypothetical protein
MSSNIKVTKWHLSDNPQLLQAISDGTVDFKMSGNEATLRLNNSPAYAFFGCKYTSKQIKNAIDRMKPRALPTSKQVELAKERMSIENELARDPMFSK